jgi:hypothetical protein
MELQRHVDVRVRHRCRADEMNNVRMSDLAALDQIGEFILGHAGLGFF